VDPATRQVVKHNDAVCLSGYSSEAFIGGLAYIGTEDRAGNSNGMAAVFDIYVA
jgi:hypothetical protein